MKAIYNLVDKLIANPTRLNLLALNKVMTVAIPFNAPHGFTIKRLEKDGVVITLPNRKLNHNHLGGIHACAMATVGEYAAGMSILTHFGIGSYRLIMSELNVTYSYQGRKDLEATCDSSAMNPEEIRKGIESQGKYNQSLTTIIREHDTGKEVSKVTMTWQLKPWSQVKTKD